MKEIVFKQLVDCLKGLESSVNMHERYQASIGHPNLDPGMLEELMRIDNRYDQNIRLKYLMSDFLGGRFDHYEQDFWIVREWGGIRRFRICKKNRDLIDHFSEELNLGMMTSLSRISSLSKIASFVFPDRYFVYDSRAIYSLNWLLLNAGETESFYPRPQGRNNILIKYKLNLIIQDRTTNPIPLISETTAYFSYCDLINRLAQQILPNGKACEIEMLLFQIAPAEIFNEIDDSYRGNPRYTI